jgi:hypothetical protein
MNVHLKNRGRGRGEGESFSDEIEEGLFTLCPFNSEFSRRAPDSSRRAPDSILYFTVALS